MSLSKDEIIDAIAEMSVMDVVELVDAMEDKFGVTAAAAVTTVAGPADADGDGGAAAEEQTEFDVSMTSFGEKKINVIKAVREITGLGLKDAKSLVEEVPSNMKEGVSKEEADEIKSKLEEVGATIEVK